MLFGIFREIMETIYMILKSVKSNSLIHKRSSEKNLALFFPFNFHHVTLQDHYFVDSLCLKNVAQLYTVNCTMYTVDCSIQIM